MSAFLWRRVATESGLTERGPRHGWPPPSLANNLESRPFLQQHTWLVAHTIWLLPLAHSFAWMSSVSLQTIFTPAEHMNNVFVCKVSGTGKIVQHCIGNLINSLQTSIFLGVMLSLNSDMFYVWQLLYLFELPHSLSTSRSPQATPVTRSRTFQRGEQGRTGKNCNWQFQTN